MGKFKVIFLDVDGVLCPYPKRQKGWVGNENSRLKAACCRHLSAILAETDAHIVLSSSWRLFPDTLEILYKRLERFGISQNRFIGQTPDLRQGIIKRTHSELRYFEIRECISRLKIEHYVIIDDFDLGKFDAAHIRTNRFKGLTRKLRFQCIKQLNR